MVRSKITIEDLGKCFNDLYNHIGDHSEITMRHPRAINDKVTPVCLEYDEDDEVFGYPDLMFKKYTTCTGADVWRLETTIDLVNKY